MASLKKIALSSIFLLKPGDASVNENVLLSIIVAGKDFAASLIVIFLLLSFI